MRASPRASPALVASGARVRGRGGTDAAVRPFPGRNIQEASMGGHQVPGQGSGDDGYDEEGYDESQRAEILEATRSGPSDGLVLTDLEPDMGDDEDDDEDALTMDSEEIGETNASVGMTEDDIDEDDAQDDFDAGTTDDDEIDDADDEALKP
jgi:hypothetical protein